jgi:hypothetical protein
MLARMFVGQKRGWIAGIAVTLVFGGCQKPEDQISIIPTTNGSGGASVDGSGGSGVGDTDAAGTGGSDQDGGAGTDGNVSVGSGGASGSGGATGSGGVIDAGPADVMTPVDLPSSPVDGPPPVVMPPPLAECNMPSIDHLERWTVASEAGAATTPAAGSILVAEGDHQVGKVSFTGGGWHIVAVLVTNSNTAQANLSASTGFTLTYSATADLWIQLRETANYMDGAHWVLPLPSTGGQLRTVFVSLAADSWITLPRLGTPKVTFPQALTQVRGIFFIGDAANTLVLRGMRFDGYTPVCL